MKCKDLKLRTKKGVKFLYCTALKDEITFDDCKGCKLKNYPALKQFIKDNPKVVKKHPKKAKKDISSKTRQLVNERDKGICQLCGKYGSINLHHIYYRSQRRDLIDEPTNLISLCVSCHKLVHTNKKKYQPMLLDIIKRL